MDKQKKSRMPHRISSRKSKFAKLEHPALEGWNWDLTLEDEAAAENNPFDNNLAVEMEGVRESTDKLKSQSLALSKMAASMKSGSSPIHYTSDQLVAVSQPGFPPPFLADQTEVVAAEQMTVAHQQASDAQAISLFRSDQTRAFRNVGPLHQSTRGRLHRGPNLSEQSGQRSFRPEPGRGRLTMATAPASPLYPRHRTLSPADITRLTWQAASRSASREIITGEVVDMNISDPQPHLPQNAYGVRSSSSLSTMTHYPQRYQNEASNYNAIPTLSRDLHVPRSRGILGYDPGHSSSLPSHLSRQTLEAVAAAAENHAARVRSMQFNLAADPNILAQTPPSVQLVAQGPPLTGHNTTSTTTLPSVLQPYSRTPTMTYAQALQAIIAETGSLQMLFRLELLDPAPVTVLLYDDNNRLTGTSENLILTKDTNLKTLVMFLQNILDTETATMPGNDGNRFLLTHIEVRNGTEEMRSGHPALKGECRGGDKAKTATFMRWITNGDMEMYWKAYRIVLQTQAPQAGDRMPAVKPIFRVKTVRQIMDARGTVQEGHQFVDILSLVSGSGATYGGDPQGYDGDEPDNSASTNSSTQTQSAMLRDPSESTVQSGGGSTTKADGHFASNSKSRYTSTSSRDTHTANYGGDAAGSTPSSTNDGARNNGGSSKNEGNDPKSSEIKTKAAIVDPTRNWGYYQRMGGNPENHKKYDLSHVPFEVKDFPGPKISFDTALEQEVVASVQRQGWNFEPPQDTLTSGSRMPVLYSAGEQRQLEIYTRNFEAARSFEDDSFFINCGTGNTDTRTNVASQHMTDKPQSGKGKGKETEANRFFESYCTPDGSEDNRMASCFDTLNIGMTHAIDEKNNLGGYATPQGRDIEPGGHGSGNESHTRRRRKSKQSWSSKDRDIQSVHDRFPQNHASIDRGISNYTNTFNNNPANTRPSFMKGSSMNVHAPEYRSYSTGLTPYLQSLTGPSPSYTQPNPYGHSQRSNAVSSIGALDAVDGFTTITLPSVQAHPSNSLAVNSPDMQYAAAGNTASPQWKLGQAYNSSMFPSSSASSPEKPLFGSGRGSRFQSPDRQNAQIRGHGQRTRSPEKFNTVGHDGVPLMRYPSPGKTTPQHHQGWGLQRDATAGQAQTMKYPHINEHDARDPRSSFHYGQGSNFEVNFDYNPNVQGPYHNNGQGPV